MKYFSATVFAALAFFNSFAASDYPVVGGPCAYSKYIGTAVITAAKRPDTLTNAYDVSFRFFTTNTIQEQWAVPSIAQEKDISAIAGIEGNMALFHIKPGNSYACTLDVISAGTCTPLIYHLKPPSPTDNIDTSSMWIMPDSVVENTPSNLNLLSYYFTCNTQFSDKLFTQTAGGIRFTYKAVENPAAGICAPSAKLYGTLFAASALTTGKYPVYSLWIPACYPLCDVAVSPRLVDTLTVVKALSIDAHGNHAHAGVSTIRIFHNNNRTVVEGLITRPGKITISFFRTTGALLGRYESADLSAGWQRIVVLDEAVSAKARAKGVVVMKVDMPGGTMVRQLMR